MRVTKGKLDGVLLFQPQVWSDERGLFMESYQLERYWPWLGLDFVQDNYSYSKQHVLRGLHYQKNQPQGKLVQVLSGCILDVIVDMRHGSPSYGQWESIELEAHLPTQLWVPPGFAHGFLSLSQTASVLYKCTEYYRPEDEGTIAWNDVSLNIPWPIQHPILSAKDRAAEKQTPFLMMQKGV